MRRPHLNRLGQGRAAPELGWDFHCHLLPGVDDGVRTLAESREAIDALKALGYRGSVVTPHIYAGVYDNTAAGLRVAFEHFCEVVDRDYDLILAAEYQADDHLMGLLAQGEALLHVPLKGERLVVAEFPYLMAPPRGMDALRALVEAGYRPVLAHVERYRYMQFDPASWLERLLNLGVWLQANVGSLAGMYGPAPQAFARKLLKQDLPVIWSSDLHRPRQVARYIAPGLRQLASLTRLNPVLDALDMPLSTASGKALSETGSST